MRSTSSSNFEIDDISKFSRSPSDTDTCSRLPSKNITVISSFQSVLDTPMSSDINLNLQSSTVYLDRYPNAAIWNNAPYLESVAPGCRLEPQSVTFVSTVLNTCKALLGAGIVALPMIFSEASLIPGIIIFILAVLLSSFSFWLIGYLSHKTTHKSWGGMWKAILSHSKCKLPSWIKAGAPIDILIILANLANGCSYTLIANANVVNVLQDWYPKTFPLDAGTKPSNWSQSQWEIESPTSLLRRQWATIFLTLCFLFPLNFVNLRKVSFVSVLGILATVLLVGAVAFCEPNNLNLKPHEKPMIWNPTSETIGCFAQFSIAVCAHSISPNFYQALERRSPSRFAKTTSCGYVLILVMNLIVAVCGYWRFGKNVQTNVLEAYSSSGLSNTDAMFINIARICISLSVLVNTSFQSRAFCTAVGNIAPAWLIDNNFCMAMDSKQETINNKQNNVKIIKILSNGTSSPQRQWVEPKSNPQDNETSQLLIRIAYTFIVLVISLCVKTLKMLFKLAAPLISSSLVYTIPGTMLLLMGMLYNSNDKAKQWKLKMMIICGIIFINIGLSCAVFGIYSFILIKQ